MSYVVAVISPGAMGSAIGKRLRQNGAVVRTSLTGRGKASVARAEAAGMVGVADAMLASSDVILSVVPPSEAFGLAQRLAPQLAVASHKPIFVDCNAISPDSVRQVGGIVSASGARFVDACIIGLPPEPGGKGPTIYLSGQSASDAMFLCSLGLDVRLLEGPIGAASALKMCYAGITKGLSGLAAAMILLAQESGAGDALREELERSQPVLLKRFTSGLPDMYPKSYRWVAEMREIAQFGAHDAGTRTLYEGLAVVFERLALDYQGNRKDIGVLDSFLTHPPSKSP